MSEAETPKVPNHKKDAHKTTEPRHPWVKFRALYKHTDPATKESIEEADEYYLDISGTHGRVESIIEFQKMGHRLMDYGNLKQDHINNLKPFLDSQLGRGLDPRLMDEDPMSKKVRAARG